MDSKKYVDDRKYSIIDKKTYIYLESEKKKGTKGLCFYKFSANFVIDNDIQDLKIGDKIKINDKILIITKVGKECFKKECDLYIKTGKCCNLTTNVAFAK